MCGAGELVTGVEAARRPVTAVVPVKRLAAAKSRLVLPVDRRRALALAFAADTVAVVCASPLVSDVLVVTSDPDVADRLRRLPVVLVPDEASDLDGAVRSGVGAAKARRPDTGIVVVPADLPCLRPADVTEVLARGRSAPGAYVPDRSTTGTTLVVYLPGQDAVTCYGPGSAARHSTLGIHAIEDAPVRARHDVDTLEDLHVARTLGVGPRTGAVLAALTGAEDGGREADR
jgi:2-phospho-L-lactate guanylyltransferase